MGLLLWLQDILDGPTVTPAPRASTVVMAEARTVLLARVEPLRKQMQAWLDAQNWA